MTNEINVLHGDTLEHAQIGDTIINGYGERGTIVAELARTWWVRSDKYGTTSPVFKHNPAKQAILGV